MREALVRIWLVHSRRLIDRNLYTVILLLYRQSACECLTETVSCCIKNTRRHARTGKCTVSVPPIALLCLRRTAVFLVSSPDPRVTCSPLFFARLSDPSSSQRQQYTQHSEDSDVLSSFDAQLLQYLTT